MQPKYSDLCQISYDGLNLSCFGCCLMKKGLEKINKAEVYMSIKRNTLEHRHCKNPYEFKHQQNSTYACSYLIYIDNSKIGCSLHPKLKKDEARPLGCQIYLCRTSRFFSFLNEKEKKTFLEFLKRKANKMDNYDFSLAMYHDYFLKELEKFNS
jgi:hypothetical protein